MFKLPTRFFGKELHTIASQKQVDLKDMRRRRTFSAAPVFCDFWLGMLSLLPHEHPFVM